MICQVSISILGTIFTAKIKDERRDLIFNDLNDPNGITHAIKSPSKILENSKLDVINVQNPTLKPSTKNKRIRVPMNLNFEVEEIRK